MLAITAITVNFKTPDLLNVCISSFRSHYPDLRYIVIDNGGCKESRRILRKLRENVRIEAIENEENAGHGLALNQGLALVETPYAFLLDSDTKCNRGGFLEKMLERFEADSLLFAIGWLRHVNDTGVAYKGKPAFDAIPYVHPHACLMDVAKFRRLPPFTTRGAPAVDTMRAALRAGYTVEDFPVSEYIWHKIGGTRGLFRGHWLPKTGEEPGKWKRYRI
jgi:glycosyltransferase involved in cell wall biosynthesis